MDTRSKEERHKTNIVILYRLERQIESLENQLALVKKNKEETLKTYLYDCDLSKYNEFMKIRNILKEEFELSIA